MALKTLQYDAFKKFGKQECIRCHNAVAVIKKIKLCKQCDIEYKYFSEKEYRNAIVQLTKQGKKIR